MNQTEKFDNPQLQEIHEKYKVFIKENKTKLDNISRDIKQIESFLKKNIFTTYKMCFQDGEINYALIFKAGRIYYLEGQDIRPLIETKVTCRLRAAPHLKFFLEKAIENSQF